MRREYRSLPITVLRSTKSRLRISSIKTDQPLVVASFTICAAIWFTSRFGAGFFLDVRFLDFFAGFFFAMLP